MHRTPAVEARLTQAMRLFKAMPDINPKDIDVLLCPYCESNMIIKYGKSKQGWQRFRCKECYKTYIVWGAKRYVHTESFKKCAIFSWQLWVWGIRFIARRFHISTNSLYRWLPIYSKSYFPWPYTWGKKQYCYNSKRKRLPRAI